VYLSFLNHVLDREDSAVPAKEEPDRTIAAANQLHDGHEGEGFPSWNQRLRENQPYNALQQDWLHIFRILPADKAIDTGEDEKPNQNAGRGPGGLRASEWKEQ